MRVVQPQRKQKDWEEKNTAEKIRDIILIGSVIVIIALITYIITLVSVSLMMRI